MAGTGQAAATRRSDAFYIYTDLAGQPITPFHLNGDFTLWINGGPADDFVQPIPPFRDDHVYNFQITAPGGPLTFAVGDTFTADNTGAYTVEVIRKGSKSSGTGVINSLKGVAKLLGLAVGELIARIKGLGPAWDGLVAGWQIKKGVDLFEEFNNPDYRARLIDEMYNSDERGPRFRKKVDDGVATGCALIGCTATSWNELTPEQQRDEDIFLSVCVNLGGPGFCSNWLLPTFMSKWLE